MTIMPSPRTTCSFAAALFFVLSSRGVCKTIEESSSWLAGILKENNTEGENYAVFMLPAETRERQQQQQQQSQQQSVSDETLKPSVMIGVVGTHRSSPVAELGYIFHPAVWGRGYATEAVQAFVEHFWALKPDVDLMEARVDKLNEASRRVLAKCGFEEEEVLEGGAELQWLTPQRRDLIVCRIRRERQPGTGETDGSQPEHLPRE